MLLHIYFLPQLSDETVSLHIIVDANGCLKKVKLFGLGHDVLR